MFNFKTYKKKALLLIFISTLLRLFIASQLEFGNDEVYYWLYAKYPDVSHFDHPSMVGFFIQFFTFDLLCSSELAIRLTAIFPASLSMYLVFLIGNYIKDEKVGFIAVALYNLSIYGLIISGTFILPDAPLLLFWLLSFYFLLQTLPYKPNEVNKTKLFLAYFFIGCAIYSKYQAVYLLLGMALYVFFFNRVWLLKWQLYVGLIFPVLAFGLIYYWNYSNDFISFKFHENRVSFFSFTFNKNSFLRELLGQFAYNNPYIFIVFWMMLFSFFKRRFTFNYHYTYLFFTVSIPLILTTIYLSMSRNTLPHWSGVSYITSLPLMAVFLSERKTISKNLVGGFSLLSILLIVACFVINFGWFLPNPTSENKENLSRKDALMDLYGWKQASTKVTKFLEENNLKSLQIVSPRWYPSAHIDYYIAQPNNMNVYGLGSLTDIHKYYWINKTLPKLKNRVLYITDSRNFRNPKDIYKDEFSTINQLTIIPIKRGSQTVKYVFLFEMFR